MQLVAFYSITMVIVGRFGGILQQPPDVERVFREHGADVGRVWSTVGLLSSLLRSSVVTRPGRHPDVGDRHVPPKFAQHRQSGIQQYQ